MSDQNRRKNLASSLRFYRTIHRTLGAFLFVVFIVISTTGLMLGWKKNSQGYIHPDTYKGSTTEMHHWLPMDSLQSIAFQILHDSVGSHLSLELKKIDVRPQKGMMKFIFNDHYYGIQLDGATGDLLQITHRYSDLIEHIHDGRILDKWLGTGNETIKLFYTSLAGLALLVFSLTGFWLWYGPKLMRKIK